MNRKLIYTLLLFFILFGVSLAQVNSIHQYQNEYYKQNHTKEKALANLLSKSKTKTQLNKTVFGYLPWWKYLTGSQNYLRYDLLSHIAVFSFEADSLGNIKNPLSWPWTDLISKAKENNVKLVMAVTSFDANAIHSLFTNVERRNKLFENFSQRIKDYSFDGINIDFENVKTADRNSVITNFFVEMKKYFSQRNLNPEISFAAPVVNFSGWNFYQIASNLDYIFIMGYDFYGSWSSTTGPSAPLTGGYYNIAKSLSSDYLSVVQNLPHKLILGVPYYGNYWRTKSPNAYSAADTSKTKKSFVKSVLFNEVASNYYSKERIWDNLSNTPWIRWQDTTWNQIWYDNDSSLALKYDLAISKNLKGVGIWALGYDDGRSELWNLIERKFAIPTDIVVREIPTQVQLYQNYPNPFNPVTTISYKVQVQSHISLKVFDVLGNEIATLVEEFKQPGYYNSQFSIQNSELTSSIYFYTLRTENYSETKKMLLLK